jgi:hypothetical protein
MILRNDQVKPSGTRAICGLTFTVLEGDYSIHRLSPGSDVPAVPSDTAFSSITRTDEEITVVCPSAIDLKLEHTEPGWSVLKVIGPLEFSLTGILAGISRVLSDAGISLFALSTWDTDYILIKSYDREGAIKALTGAGHFFRSQALTGD